jgi:hypothetical protein
MAGDCESEATAALSTNVQFFSLKALDVPIPGTTKPHRLEENLGAANIQLAPDDLRAIDSSVEDRGREIGSPTYECSRQVVSTAGRRKDSVVSLLRFQKDLLRLLYYKAVLCPDTSARRAESIS